jgi:hypothetical protein
LQKKSKDTIIPLFLYKEETSIVNQGQDFFTLDFSLWGYHGGSHQGYLILISEKG